MDVSLVIRQRLQELGLGQKELAAAAQVTESYISQLLARKKAPPAPERTRIYERIGHFLRLPPGRLTRLAESQRQSEWKKKVAALPLALHPRRRQSLLALCAPAARGEVSRIFEKEANGELERLITQTLREACNGPQWRELREWTVDLKTFAVTATLRSGEQKQFAFVECASESVPCAQPGFQQFLHDAALSSDATEEEIAFLGALRFGARKPTALYYYRELQSLRDPLHFRTV